MATHLFFLQPVSDSSGFALTLLYYISSPPPRISGTLSDFLDEFESVGITVNFSHVPHGHLWTPVIARVSNSATANDDINHEPRAIHLSHHQLLALAESDPDTIAGEVALAHEAPRPHLRLAVISCRPTTEITGGKGAHGYTRSAHFHLHIYNSFPTIYTSRLPYQQGEPGHYLLMITMGFFRKLAIAIGKGVSRQAVELALPPLEEELDVFLRGKLGEVIDEAMLDALTDEAFAFVKARLLALIDEAFDRLKE